jgi:hypothetical protein
MNENDLRYALRATMESASAPPPMNETPVLDAARREQRRRRAQWAGAGSAVAASAVVGLAVVVVGATSGPGGLGAAGGTPPSTTGGEPSGTASGDPSDTQTSWPNGQQDRTATSGPEFNQGQALLDEVTASVPPGFGAPRDLKYQDPDYDGGPMRFSQAQYVDTVDGDEVWEYEGVQPVTKGKGVGELTVVETTPGNGAAGDGCALKPTMWNMTGTCQEHVVDGKRVGVFTAKAADPGAQFDSWAGYRDDDGTVVFVAQDDSFDGSGRPALSQQPLSAKRLAELAADPRFHLD